ncbi:MAG: DUF4114 domain-containing protein [Polyangiaceae bacterium]|nr:DUF4114 domain-containing protein [Polyangiaceae bacterium]
MRSPSRLWLLGLAGLVVPALVTTDAAAVIVQINGDILPQSPSHLQVGLDRGENGCPNPGNAATCYANEATPVDNAGNPGSQGPIDPILEAGLDPQVFGVPKDGSNNFGVVDFVFLYRGSAGYRNSFGWYNVGDDLSDLSNLHQVVVCNPAVDPPPSATNWKVTVDFQAEYAKQLGGMNGYKGGFIGFYLVTPQGNSGACDPGGGTNCGRPDIPSCVGRIYYTEREINGDGNYVHYLVYQSRVLDAQKKRVNDYYFGFEDLYRGGDNDFKDVTMLVKGLVVPCTPQPEVCDGKDNNCDGIIDNHPSDAGGACSQIPGNPVGKGTCKSGVLTCQAGALSCQGEVGPQAEACNAQDDDCNGTIDDPPGGAFVPALPSACGPLQGACKATTQCVAGAPTCVTTTGPQPETCNGVDDDCDGTIDDNPSDVGIPCTPSPSDPVIGECKRGQTVCSPATPGDPSTDALVCQGYKGPTPELCNGKDDDCDGQTDDAPTDLAASCKPSDPNVKVCDPGKEICLNGAKVCAGFTFGKPEVCNGLDDDCNGTIDDNLIDENTPCGASSVGECKPGVSKCTPKTPGSPATNELTCTGATTGTSEICDGKDNDCDGQVDEDPQSLPGVGVDCSTACGAGKILCKDGKLQCAGVVGGSAEVCNGKDDDCNGVVDDDPIDAGGPCGEVVINPKVKQDPMCRQGVLLCKPDGAGGAKLTCEMEGKGTSEACNGVDDDCDGVVDDGVPGEGVDCAPDGLPAGTKLPLLGECKPGKSYCLDAAMKCVGGIGPQAEVCDGKDNDCDGVADDMATCPGESSCIQGECRIKCTSSGEFDTCPGGQECKQGFCQPKGGQGGQGGAAGKGGSGGASGGGTGSGGKSGNGAGGTSSGGNGGSGAGANAGNGGNGAGGSAGNGSAGKSGGQAAGGAAGGESGEVFGLTTGGGGCDVAAVGPRRAGAWVGLLGLLWAAARRRRRAEGEVSR